MFYRRPIFFSLISIVGMAIIVTACRQEKAQEPVKQPKIGLANPASVACINMGGRIEITDEKGGQVGWCHLPDGRVCEEWALFRDKQCVSPSRKS